MNWLIPFVGAASATVVFILLFHNNGYQGMPGNEGTQIDFGQPLPIQHYDFQVGKKWKSKSDAMFRALKKSLEDARRICEEMRSANSAVVELNLAKLTLDLVERHGSSLNSGQTQKLLNYVRNALDRAGWFIKHHGQKRYVEGIHEYLRYQERRLSKLK